MLHVDKTLVPGNAGVGLGIIGDVALAEYAGQAVFASGRSSKRRDPARQTPNSRAASGCPQGPPEEHEVTTAARHAHRKRFGCQPANWPVLYALVHRRSASTKPERQKAPTGVSVKGVEPTLDLQSNDPFHFSSTSWA